MSDISTLSHEYEANALFADEMNTLVLILKKHSLRPNNADLHAVQESKEKLGTLLDGLLAALKPEIVRTTSATSVENRTTVPAEVLERISEQFKNTLPYFLDDIQGVAAKLQRDAEIDPKGLVLLDTLCDVTDGVASNAFRRLWRR